MIYPRSKSSKLDQELFKNPTSEYRAAPFWAWNCKLDKEQLLRQIRQLKEMGMGGFMIHARNGLATQYLGDEFMNLVKACNQKGNEEGMLTWLYDEDRYPSGSAGGMVTKNRDLSAKYLLFTPYSYGNAPEEQKKNLLFSVPRQENGELLSRYAVELDSDGFLTYYKRLEKDEEYDGAGHIWYAYLETVGESPWFNMEMYSDNMNKEAVEKFIQITHEAYYKKVGDEFGKTIPAIFTDEPQIAGKGRLEVSTSLRDVTLPCTKDLSDTFKAKYGYDLLDKLPELIWEFTNKQYSKLRYDYHQHTNDRFYEAFFETIGKWCDSHNICFTGHLMSEHSLLGQYLRLGEAMRLYDAFQLPGIDILSDNREYTTAKQAQSVVHQNGQNGMISELYGVTNWDYDFRGHKLQGDWQAALGVTVRVPHLTWVSMEGEAKRDYPASIGYQSPWYKEYFYVEDHFARLNTVLTRGKPEVHVAVVHPVESYWMISGPVDKTLDECTQMDNNFKNLCEWLIFGQIDFDYISECLLEEKCSISNKSFKVGEMSYDAVIVSDCINLRSTTVKFIDDYANSGGKVIFTGRVPEMVDALPSQETQKLIEKSEYTNLYKTQIISALDDYRIVDICSERGNRTDNLIYQMRIDEDCKWLFICHGRNPEKPDIVPQETITISIKGTWKPLVYETITGEIKSIDYYYENNKTIIPYSFYAYDSLLLKLTSCDKRIKLEKKLSIVNELTSMELPLSVPIRLSEPNVLLLDLAVYAYDDGTWQSMDEILRIDAQFRSNLGYPKRDGYLKQPWTITETEQNKHSIKLRFRIESQVDISDIMLAIEHPELADIKWNGQSVETHVNGWFVDESIKKVGLPPLVKGTNFLEINMPIGKRIGAEWCYLLGDFGVRTSGSKSIIIEPVRYLTFGDWCSQGLPFYAGNVTYCIDIETKDKLQIEAAHFRNPVLRVDLDGKKQGLIAYAPYQLKIDTDEGKHLLEITAYGNRYNAFGAVHNADDKREFIDPLTWRTTGNEWSYEYKLRPMGILVRPIIKV